MINESSVENRIQRGAHAVLCERAQAGRRLTVCVDRFDRAGEPAGHPSILNSRIAVEHIAHYFKDGCGVTDIQRDLPQLYGQRPGQWVAYRGDQQVGFADQKHILYQQCFDQGLQREEFVVFCIEPQETEITLGPVVLD